MMPFTSGKIHIGHIRNAGICDAICIFWNKFKNKIIYQPISWDSAGLPTEQKALSLNIDPYKWTKDNILKMKEVLKDFCFSLNWDIEFYTSDFHYYKFDQILFLKLFKHGYVYRQEKELDYCNFCKTILAKEQVLKKQFCWRCDNITTKIKS